MSALFAAPLVIDWNDYRSVFETQAANLLGRQVKVGGKVHLVLLPAPELKFDDIKVADQEGRLDRPFLEARSFEAWLNIGALLTGTIEARKIAIVDPILRLDLKADGTGNWSDVGRRGVALPFAPKDVMLDEVSCQRRQDRDHQAGCAAVHSGECRRRSERPVLSGPYKVSATYSFDGRPQELRFSTSAPDAAGLFRIKSALRDLDRNTSYILDGGVTGLGAMPVFDGTIVVRAANRPARRRGGRGGRTPRVTSLGRDAPRDKASRFELKGPIKATPDRAELPEFDLTVHAKGHPQIFKGKLALDFGERIEASRRACGGLCRSRCAVRRAWRRGAAFAGRLSFTCLPTRSSPRRPSSATERSPLSSSRRASAAISSAPSTWRSPRKDGAADIERLKAVLPGDNRIEASGRLSRGEFGPVFAGPVKVEGSGLRPLTRWAVGDRDMSGQASVGDFTFMANATIGDGVLKLADAAGELSGTKFRGGLRLQGGERRLIELTLDSDRLDLREVIGEGPLWRSWLPSSGDRRCAPTPVRALFRQLRGDDMRVTLRVGELLLPNIPAGKLDARFALQGDTLDVEQLDFAAANALALNGKGRIERLSASALGPGRFRPSGRHRRQPAHRRRAVRTARERERVEASLGACPLRCPV